MPSQMIGAGSGALAGAGSGAAVGGPVGAGVGALAGGALGYFGSSEKGYSLPWDQYNSRLGQIANYDTQLKGATNNYATALSNMYATTFSQYVPNLEAKYASRGLGFDSGAFGAQLGLTAATLSAEGMTDVAKMNINNLDKVQGQYGSAWDAMFGATNRSNEVGFNQSNANIAGLLGTAAGLGRIGLSGRPASTTNPFSDHPQASGYAGFGEDKLDLAGQEWGF